jgi:hypothetical protein
MQTSYHLLATIELLHTYFQGDVMQGFHLHPDQRSKQVIQQQGLRLRPLNNRLEIYYSQQPSGPAPLNDVAGLTFHLQITDPLFLNYTWLPITSSPPVYAFSNQREANRLSKQEYVTGEDIAEGQLSLPAETFGLIDLSLSLPEGNSQPPVYQLKFAARPVVWRYYIIEASDESSAALSIESDNFPASFIDKGMLALPNNQQARVFESAPEVPVPLQELPAYDLQLQIAYLDHTNSIRLPYPSPQSLKAMDAGEQDQYAAEMYIYV